MCKVFQGKQSFLNVICVAVPDYNFDVIFCNILFFSQNFKDIHHLLTDDEREMIFGHPFVEYGGYHCMKAVLK